MKTNPVDKNSPDALQKKIDVARQSLLMIILFTVINLVMLVADSGYYFLFSISVPYFLTAFCMGMDIGLGTSGIGTFTIVALAVSAVVLGIYLLCWGMSKKKAGWLITALVLFVLDTLILLLVVLAMEDLLGSIVDILFHVWVIVELVQAISANRKLKKLPPEPVDPQNYIHVQDPEAVMNTPDAYTYTNINP